MPQTTKYLPEYDDLVVEVMAKGKPFVQFCADVSISKRTAYNWLESHPSFATAYELGQVKLEAFMAEDCLKPPETSPPAIYIMRLANITKWRRSDEKTTQEVVTKMSDASEAQLEAELKRIRAERDND